MLANGLEALLETLVQHDLDRPIYTAGGDELGAVRSKPTLPPKRPANRRMTASPIRPFEPWRQ